MPAQKRSPTKPLNQFELITVEACALSARRTRRPEYCECCPIARSGHRIFADEDFVYIIGGYNPLHTPDSTYTDIWRFNRLTQLWQKCQLAADSPVVGLPNTLASFSLAPGSGRLNECLIYGGTGVPFGVAASDQMHSIRIDVQGHIHLKEQRKQPGQAPAIGEMQPHQLWDENGNLELAQQMHLPPRMYGHAMCRGGTELQKGKLVEVVYLVGGTTGHIYNMDVWRLERPQADPDAQWKCTQLNQQGQEIGRYRLEVVVHGQRLYTFGGGAPEFISDFDTLLAFNLATGKFERIQTKPDPEFGLPRGRKCHALVHRGRLAYIIGGCRDGEAGQQQHRVHQITNDVWRFDMESAQWTRVKTSMAKPVFFHSAALTPDDCVFVFGGCSDESSQTRCNRLQRMWLQPPSLKYASAMALMRSVPDQVRQRISNEGIRLSDTQELISRFFAPSLAA